MDEKSIYQSSNKSIFAKQFLAGFARSLGATSVTIVMWILLYVVFVKIVLPQLQGPLDTISTLVKLLPKPSATTKPSSSPTTGGTEITIPDSLIKQFQGNK